MKNLLIQKLVKNYWGKLNNLNKSKIFNYAILAFPLAFVGLPIYVNISDFYAKEFALNLSLIGFLLFFVRLIDLAQEPFIGYFSDFAAKKNFGCKKIILSSSLLLSLCFFLLFNPPKFLNSNFIIAWFIFFLSATYTFFNFTVINFESIAVKLAKDNQERISINSAKEFFGLIGVLCASIMPTILAYFFQNNLTEIYFSLSLTFVILLLAVILFFFRKVEISNEQTSNNLSFKIIFLNVWKNKIFLKFLLIFLINSIAVSIPAATVIFYVEDVLQTPQYFGFFLGIYFLSGCFFIPFWKKLAQKFGKIPVWIFSIFGSVLTFIFAYFLDAQSAQYFFAVSFLSGMFLGADLIMPPAIIADLIFEKKAEISSHLSLWNMTSKMGLMLASSSSLIILGSFNYQPGSLEKSGVFMLPFIYAILPCLLKIVVIFLLFRLKNYQKTYEN